MKERLIELLDGADLFLRNRINSKPAPLNEYDIEQLKDIAKVCDEAARTLERAIVPPCKVGDVVYKPIITDDTHEPAIWDITISQISIETGKLFDEAYAVGTICKSNSGESFDFKEIGKTVFLTKEEAEQALKERGVQA